MLWFVELWPCGTPTAYSQCLRGQWLEIKRTVETSWLSGTDAGPGPETRTFTGQKQLDEALQSSADQIILSSLLLRATSAALILLLAFRIWRKAPYGIAASAAFAVLLFTRVLDVFHLDRFHSLRSAFGQRFTLGTVNTLDALWTNLAFLALVASALAVVTARWEWKERLQSCPYR